MEQYKNGNGKVQKESIELTSVNNYFSERSEAAQEIITRKPSFIEKWALLIFMSILLCLIIGTWFIKYPDIVTGTVILLGENSPKEIVPNRSGRLIRVFVKNNQPVKAGEILAWLESNASTQEVLVLSEKVEKSIQYLKSNEHISILSIFNSPSYQLGELQTHYREFISTLTKYTANADHSSFQKQVSSKKKVIDLIGNSTLIPFAKIEEAVYLLKGNIDNWLRQYTLQSPTDGLVAFISSVQQDKYITQGTLLGYIIPYNDKYYAEVKLSQKNLKEIDTGMKVQLRFDAYPYQEIGVVSGKLTDLSKIVADSLFIGTVHLDKGLTTNLNNVIPFKSGLQGQAVIITKNRRLLNRFYHKLF
jgi:multidrug resistance efflux pump